jgi:uncharacterized lipoprotein YddW (UPF0748 family)
VIEARDRIPTAIAVLSGQRNRPTALSLIREKVDANREQGLGTGFFYLESLWNLGPEPASERITALKQLLAPQGEPAVITAPSMPGATPPPPPPAPAPPVVTALP